MTGLFLLFLIALVILAAAIGRSAKFSSLGDKKSSLGILIDVRQRFSLNRLQLVLWTLLILASFLAVLVTAGYQEAFDIPQYLLGLLGISAGSATVAGAVKDGKNVSRPETIARGGQVHPRALKKHAAAAEAARSRGAEAPVIPASDIVKPRWSQIFLEEEGEQADRVVSVSKFQNFVFTLALVGVYVGLTIQAGDYPQFNDKVLWLLGISHAGYVGGKVPDKGENP